MKSHVTFCLLLSLWYAIPASAMNNDIDNDFSRVPHTALEIVSISIQKGQEKRQNTESDQYYTLDTPGFLQDLAALEVPVYIPETPGHDDDDNKSRSTARAASQIQPNEDDDYITPNQEHHEQNEVLRKQQ